MDTTNRKTRDMATMAKTLMITNSTNTELQIEMKTLSATFQMLAEMDRNLASGDNEKQNYFVHV